MASFAPRSRPSDALDLALEKEARRREFRAELLDWAAAAAFVVFAAACCFVAWRLGGAR